MNRQNNKRKQLAGTVVVSMLVFCLLPATMLGQRQHRVAEVIDESSSLGSIIRMYDGTHYLVTGGSANSCFFLQGKTATVSGAQMTIQDCSFPLWVEEISVENVQINGEFKGWDDDVSYTLMDGRTVTQTNYSYCYSYAYSPSALLYSRGGATYLVVKGGCGNPMQVTVGGGSTSTYSQSNSRSYSSNVSSNSSLHIVNYSSITANVVYVVYNPYYRSWTSQGWYTVHAGASLTVDLGFAYTGKIYLYAESGAITWQGNPCFNMMVDGTDAFTYTHADTRHFNDFQDKRVCFQEFVFQNPVFTWTLTD